MLSLFFTLSACWCPLLHQVVARHFSSEYFPHLTELQRNSFILGAIYADGVDKSLTHSIPRLRNLINQQLDDPESELYWFFMGVFAHIGPDMFAHAGRTRSFIVSYGLRHHISEVIVDSLISHMYNPPFMTLTPSLKQSISDLGIQFVKPFNFIYPFVFLASKLPFYLLLSKVENNRCPKADLDLSISNFQKHYEAMIETLRLGYPKFFDPSFNNLRMQEMATALVFEISCCEVGNTNQTIRNYDRNRFFANFISSSSFSS